MQIPFLVKGDCKIFHKFFFAGIRTRENDRRKDRRKTALQMGGESAAVRIKDGRIFLSIPYAQNI